MFDLAIGFSLGIDQYFSKLLFGIKYPIPFIVLISVCIFFKNRNYVRKKDINLSLFALVGYGLSLGLVRYFFNYNDFSINPIFRQTSALLLGILILLALKTRLKRTEPKNLMLAIQLTSIPFLVFGLYQVLTDHMVSTSYRITSLFSEPSYYGDYLVLLIAPVLIARFKYFSSMSLGSKLLIFIVTILWGVNFLFLQSGTAVLKLLSLCVCFYFFYPINKKIKIILIATAIVVTSVFISLNKGYTYDLVTFTLQMWQEPDLFLKNPTFYDRFYPIYSAMNNLLSTGGFFGLGFGGDYYEFNNLFPPSTHEVMIATKPTLSFFNSFASKFILYFGIFGLGWISWMFVKGLRSKNNIFKVGFLNILITSLWGIANFSLPYVWFWLALIEDENNHKD